MRYQNEKASAINRERGAFSRDFRPKHSFKFEQFSREWFEACDQAFCRAMERAGYQRTPQDEGRT